MRGSYMRKFTIHGILPLLVLVLAWGCSGDRDEIIVEDGDNPPTANTTTCLGCHSSETELKASSAALGSATLVKGPEVPPPGMSDG